MPKQVRRAICWVRRDLRLYDHRPLATACDEADEVVIVFVFDTAILDRLPDKDDRRVTFIHRSLREMDETLRSKHGSRLVALHGDPMEEIPKLAAKWQAQAVFTSRDGEPDAVKRDNAVARALERDGRGFHLLTDQVIFQMGDLVKPDGEGFRVYTPYANAWKEKFDPERDAADWKPDLTALARSENLQGLSSGWSLQDIGFDEAELWLEAGESAGRRRLDEFTNVIGTYASERDFPALPSTSRLSVHLRFGTVSIRDCVRRAMAQEQGGSKWLAELIWREFYQDILYRHPRVAEEPFQEQYKNIEYPGTDEHFQAWCEGQTGYPIVDAAMRCFNATGWMHNRLRMVVASFLTKDLLVDYRQGEAYFARYLLDFDLANNNGGWQWAAGTGVDAQPYFRIFNPILQSRKFDPQGEFIREWVPELADLDRKEIHWPHGEGDLFATPRGYPAPIVDHKVQREKAIRLLEKARS